MEDLPDGLTVTRSFSGQKFWSKNGSPNGTKGQVSIKDSVTCSRRYSRSQEKTNHHLKLRWIVLNQASLPTAPPLDWTGLNLASGKRGAIPDHLDPILKRAGIASSGWCDLIEQFGRLFKRAVGSPKALAEEAEARGQKYLQGPRTTAYISG